MHPFAEREVRLDELPPADRRRLYLGCYWRAVMYVLAQTAVLVPLAVFLMINPDWFSTTSALAPVIGLAVMEVINLALGFGLVAMFTRQILRVRFGRLRFAVIMVTCDPA